MQFFLKNLGIGMVMIGTLCLIVPFFLQVQTNASLLVGWLLVVIGWAAYIVLNKLTS